MSKSAVMVMAAGMLVGVVASSIGIASAQMTQQKIEQHTKNAAEKGAATWDSLTPAQQQKAAAAWKMDAAQAKAKWDSLSPEQQTELKNKAVAEGKKAEKKFQSLPKQ